MTREKGIIEYQIELLPDSKVIDQWPQQFLSTDLLWYWYSTYCDSISEHEHQAHSPFERSLTVLTKANEQALSFDLHDIDEDFNRRDMKIFGCERTSEPTLLNPEAMHVALNSFIEREEGPIQIVIRQIHDSGVVSFFVGHKPIEVVESLLKSWGIDETTITEVCTYNKNSGYALEQYVRRNYKEQRK